MNRFSLVSILLLVWPLTSCSIHTVALASQADERQPLATEPIPNVESLPTVYPDTWIFAHDLNFNSLLDGKVMIVDVAAKTRNFKGMIGAGMMGQFQPARQKSELYVGQTFHSRRTYGERTDALIVFDKSTLKPIAEVVLPPKRQQIVTQPNSFQLTDGERLGLVMNFTPAVSVTVVDLHQRQVLQEIPIPGCNFVFPTGRRGFSTICADGGLVSYELNEDGSIDSKHRTPPFMDIQVDPVFAKNTNVNGITFFPSYQGRMQPIDFRQPRPVVHDAWSIVPTTLRSQNWRPSGWQVIAGSEHEIFVVMQPDGKEGSHKSGGSEVWVLDPNTKSLSRRIPLDNGGLSITVTHSDPAYLVVTNADMELDIYATSSGELLRNISLGSGANPFVLYPN